MFKSTLEVRNESSSSYYSDTITDILISEGQEEWYKAVWSGTMSSGDNVLVEIDSGDWCVKVKGKREYTTSGNKYNIDTIAEWCVEYTGVVPNVLTYQYTPIATVQGFDFQTGIDTAKKLIDDYISVLECYYVNVEHDVQSVMDDWIRNLKQKSNYFMERALMD